MDMPHHLTCWVWAANGMPYFPDPKRGAVCSPTPQIFGTGSKTSGYRTSCDCHPFPVSQSICHSHWNFRDSMIQKHHSKNCSSSAMDFSDVALGLAALLVAVISALVAVLVASTFAAPPPPKRSQLLGLRKIEKG